MIETDAVEAVLEREHALDLVGLDHRGEDVADGEGRAVARKPVRDRENSTEVVRGVAPLGGVPGIVEIEPADRRADVEGRLHRIQLEARAGDAGAVLNDGARGERPEELGAGGVLQRLQAAAERVHQAQPRGVVGLGAFYFALADVIGDVNEDLVRFGPDIGNRRGHQYSFLTGAPSFGTSVGWTPGSPDGGAFRSPDGGASGSPADGTPCCSCITAPGTPDGGSRRQR